MARGLVEMMWPCMRWWASQCHLQPPDPLQTIPLTTSSPPRGLLPSHTTIRILPMMSSLVTSKQNMVHTLYSAISLRFLFQHLFLYNYTVCITKSMFSTIQYSCTSESICHDTITCHVTHALRVLHFSAFICFNTYFCTVCITKSVFSA